VKTLTVLAADCTRPLPLPGGRKLVDGRDVNVVAGEPRTFTDADPILFMFIRRRLRAGDLVRATDEEMNP
jgi:hypothetical protein